MASKLVLSFFNATLQACFIEGTRVRESGLIVSTEVLAGETILFFHIDCEDGRNSLGIAGKGAKICDYLVFYTKDDDSKEIICLLELKGKDLNSAIEQIIQTYRNIHVMAKEHLGKHVQQIRWKTCICMHGQAPRNRQSDRDTLIRVFGKENVRIKHGVKHDAELGFFLREHRK